MRARFQVAVLASTASLLACGGSTLGASCGEGTIEVDGRCVVADASSSAHDSDAPDGGTRADTDRVDSAAVKDTESRVDTDAAADSSIGDVSSDAANDGSSDAAPDETSVADSALDASEDGSIDVAPDTPSPIYGDECPGSLINVNCSTTCGGVTTICSDATCSTNDTPNLKITSASQLPFVMRTPAYPGIDPKCQPRCGAGDTVYGMAVHVNLTSVSGYGIRVRVSDPWTIRQFSVLQPWCSAFGHRGACAIFSLPNPKILIATSDPNAPSRNVYIDIAKDKNACD